VEAAREVEIKEALARESILSHTTMLAKRMDKEHADVEAKTR